MWAPRPARRSAARVPRMALKGRKRAVTFHHAAETASSRVERSPSGRPSSRARNRRRMILPLRVRGRSLFRPIDDQWCLNFSSLRKPAIDGEFGCVNKAVVSEAWDDAFATSSGSPERPDEIFEIVPTLNWRSCPPVWANPCNSGIAIGPALSRLARMWRSARSSIQPGEVSSSHRKAHEPGPDTVVHGDTCFKSPL